MTGVNSATTCTEYKFIKITVIVLLGKNNESREQRELPNFVRKYMGICIQHIPDGHIAIYTYYISVIRNNASATVFKMESQF
jgi:hypothetical protein